MDMNEYETNVLLINGVKSIAFHVYEPTTDASQTATPVPPEIESSLRDEGRIYYLDSSRRVLWLFYITRTDGVDATLQDGSSQGMRPTATIAGANLTMTQEGYFEPLHLFRARNVAPSNTNTPVTASSQTSLPDPSQHSIALDRQASSDQETKHALTSATSTSAKDAYDLFISALLSTLSASFCRRLGAIPLNHCTVLLNARIPLPGQPTDSRDGESAVTGTFKAYLTTMGTLMVSMYLSLSEGLLRLNDVPSTGQIPLSTQVLAAPFGVLGVYQGLSTSSTSDAVGQTPDTRLWRVRANLDARSAKWKAACLRILKSRGLPPSLLEDCTWIALQLNRKKPGDSKANAAAMPASNTTTIVSWPSVLCFRRKPTSSGTYMVDDAPMSSLRFEMYDSLAEVKTWFLTGAERDESILQRRKARDFAAAREAQAIHHTQQLSTHSPVDPRRMTNSVAAGAVYPTPPDGIQNPVWATPVAVNDGNTSSPGAPPSIVAPADMYAVMGNTTTNTEPDVAVWDTGEHKRERGDTFLEGDNLFGDMGPDMFGDADITDADFNFFDEQQAEEDGGLDFPSMPTLHEPAVLPLEPVLEPAAPEPSVFDEAKEAMPPPSSPKFTKPELKHARSNLTEETRHAPVSSKQVGIKREPSPFDPDTVYKKVRASLRIDNSPVFNRDGTLRRKGSIFDGVDFEPGVPIANRKYEVGGRFDWSTVSTTLTSNPTTLKPPTTDYLRRHGKQNRRPKKLDDNTSALIHTITGSLENSTLQEVSDMQDGAASDADDMSIESDLGDSPEPLADPASPFKSSAKRVNLEEDIASHVTSVKDAESIIEDLDPSLALDLPRIARAEGPEVVATKFFADASPLPMQLSLNDEDFITVAQILTEQAVSGNLGLRCSSSAIFSASPALETRRQLAILARASTLALKEVIPSSLGPTASCGLKGVIEVADVPLHGPLSRFQPRPVPSRDANAEPPKPNNLYPIPTPHLEVKRLDAKLSILPSSVSFWETLGLGPSQGGKNINSICVFPGADDMGSLASAFLNRIRHTYEFLKLGSFELLGSRNAGMADGLAPWDPLASILSPNPDVQGDGISLEEALEALSHRLLTAGATEKNFVVYFVHAPNRPGSVVEACAAFQRLFEAYKRLLTERRQTVSNELVLQLIPAEFLTSPSGMPSAEPDDLIKLALETYDRCTLFGGPMPAPAIVLEQPIPRGIDFRLNNIGSASLMHENTCIHIAYAQSIDERWITAAWTDNRGNQQMTASYSLGRRGKLLAISFNDVAHEIWETTHDLLSRWKVHWRVIITKSGQMEQSEMDFWTGLAQTESQASISLTLISVDTSPSLQLLPPSVRIPATVSNSFYTTPVSTPQPSTASPDQSGTPATPAKEHVTATTPGGGGTEAAEPADGDAILVDITDHTWGAILSHRLGSPASTGELHSSLVSGYLIKRGGTKAEDPPVAMEVNILHTDGNPRAVEALMREMLSNFRGLSTLARARGVVDRETDVRPWHIAAAEKGVRTLYLLM